MVVYSSNTKTLTLLNYDRSHLAMSMMRSSCLFTWWLSMMEESRATIHFLRRNMEFSFLRKDNQQLQSSSFHPITFLFRVSRPDRTRVEILRQIRHSLFLSFLIVLLFASAKVQQFVQLRLQEHLLQPLHVVLQSCRLQVLHHPPHRRHHGVALVG